MANAESLNPSSCFMVPLRRGQSLKVAPFLVSVDSITNENGVKRREEWEGGIGIIEIDSRTFYWF